MLYSPKVSPFLDLDLSMFIFLTMRFLTPILTLAAVAHSHYNFPSMNGGTAWPNVRQWTDYYAYTPDTNVSSLDIRCNVNGTVAFAASILSVAAGSNLTWTASPDIYHPGPLMAYMAKVPTGKTAANWDGSGTVWFKIYEDHPTVGSSALIWPSMSKNSISSLHNPSNVTTGATSVSFKIPAGGPIRELSLPYRAYRLTRCLKRWWCTVLSFLWSVGSYRGRVWNSKSNGSVSGCVHGDRSGNSVRHLLSYCE